jgi:hypothetical protein
MMFYIVPLVQWGQEVTQMVEALSYKPKSLGFNYR